jgi:hypothetical protein
MPGHAAAPMRLGFTSCNTGNSVKNSVNFSGQVARLGLRYVWAGAAKVVQTHNKGGHVTRL